jgi:hypothetical protein
MRNLVQLTEEEELGQKVKGHHNHDHLQAYSLRNQASCDVLKISNIRARAPFFGKTSVRCAFDTFDAFFALLHKPASKICATG